MVPEIYGKESESLIPRALKGNSKAGKSIDFCWRILLASFKTGSVRLNEKAFSQKKRLKLGYQMLLLNQVVPIWDS